MKTIAHLSVRLAGAHGPDLMLKPASLAMGQIPRSIERVSGYIINRTKTKDR